MKTTMATAAVPKLRSIPLTGPAGRLEAVLNEGSPDAPFAALIAHPHPPSGGTMHHKVVYHAMKVMNAPEWGFRWPALRFNFRGTGLSHGAYDGRAETGDVLAALDWLTHEYHKPILAAGFSFGAAITLAASCSHCDTRNIRAIAALGLPIQSTHRAYEHPYLENCPLPKLFLSGDHDEFAPREELASITAKAQPAQTIFIPNSDHFFTGRIDAMQAELAAWLKELLP
jgi:alpha/beta superfamily hydrolase